ncbi:putative transcriptional regulator [Azospirillum baldaniorum]|uniref:CopG family ribbon-helix-helix protein n=1 Tax=Azospirillum baldaniorum TaxID=1064539 RepID=UPI0011A5EF27|nr:hypothetical protein [Azospirillum baldaniorum]TWA70659.1 putative transcriptional regulator [Azospirillum baldaniorum]
MGKTVRVNAEISEDLNASLQRLADEHGWSKDVLIEQALQAFVRTEAQFAAAVQDGITAWRTGETVEHSDVVADFERRYGQAR